MFDGMSTPLSLSGSPVALFFFTVFYFGGAISGDKGHKSQRPISELHHSRIGAIGASNEGPLIGCRHIAVHIHPTLHALHALHPTAPGAGRVVSFWDVSAGALHSARVAPDVPRPPHARSWASYRETKLLLSYPPAPTVLLLHLHSLAAPLRLRKTGSKRFCCQCDLTRWAARTTPIALEDIILYQLMDLPAYHAVVGFISHLPACDAMRYTALHCKIPRVDGMARTPATA